MITILPAPEKLKTHYESQMGLSKENIATKIRDLYEKINESPELYKLWTSNTSNNWINEETYYGCCKTKTSLRR